MNGSYPLTLLMVGNNYINNTKYQHFIYINGNINMHQSLAQSRLTPQIKIYNRYFYLRREEHQLLQQQHYQQIQQLANKPKITVSSYQILVDQLQRKILAVLKQVATQESSYYNVEEESIVFSQFQMLICELTGINQGQNDDGLQKFQSQLWLVLGKYELKPEIQASLTFAVFRILLDPYNLTQTEIEALLNQIDQFKQSQVGRLKFLQKHPDLKEQLLTLSQIIKLWNQIRYKHPHFTSTNRKHEKLAQPTFQPQLSQRSRILAQNSITKFMQNHEALINSKRFYEEGDGLQKYYSQKTPSKKKISYFDVLHKRKLQKDLLPFKNIDKINEQNELIRKNEKLAHPQEVKQIVNNLYVKKQKRDDLDYKKINQQKQLKLCTFHPEINEYYGSNRSTSPKVNGYSKQIDRMRKGIQEKKRKKEAYENLGRVKNKSMYGSTNSKGPSFLSRDTPKLILEIRIDESRMQKLSLKGNEDPHLVAKKFVTKHGLEESMVQVLQSLVDEQLDTL